MLTLLAFLFAILALIKSAGIFVAQASSLAHKLKVNDFLIGFTVVAFGTSLPELISTIFSASSGHPQLVVSAIVGSNIANICLILGLVSIFATFTIKKRDVDVNIPLNMAALMAFWALSVFMGFVLDWSAGVSLISVFIFLLILSKDYNHLSASHQTFVKFNPLVLAFSLLALVLSGKVCISQTISLASQLKISESILGYFLLAIGTSLPELATTYSAVKKNEGEIGIGNILGSNLFNLLFILGVSSFIHPVNLEYFKTDFVFLTAVSIITYGFAILGKKYSFSRREGVGLLLLYLVFIVLELNKNRLMIR